MTALAVPRAPRPTSGVIALAPLHPLARGPLDSCSALKLPLLFCRHPSRGLHVVVVVTLTVALAYRCLSDRLEGDSLKARRLHIDQCGRLIVIPRRIQTAIACPVVVTGSRMLRPLPEQTRVRFAE